MKTDPKIYVLGVLLVSSACVEEIEPEILSYDKILVVEGTITDEMGRHEILLSKTTPLDTVYVLPETGATIEVMGSNGSTYGFTEIAPGRYQSILDFRAEPGNSYQLQINTTDGQEFRSEQSSLASNPGITEAYAETRISENGEEELAIYVDAINNQSDISRYRYRYEETYQLIAPRWSAFDFVVINDVFPFFEVDITPRTREERVCYATESSTEIIQASTSQFTENQILKFPIRSLLKSDYRIAHRYSILIRQMAQTQDAYSFYQNLRDYSSVTNLFSALQPGRIEGNLESVFGVADVIGFFEVSAVKSKRIFVNYEDHFDGLTTFSYPINCQTLGSEPLFSPGSHPMGVTTSPLIDAIQAGVIKYVADNENPGEGQGPYFTTLTPCGDCTVYGSNVQPEFWID